MENLLVTTEWLAANLQRVCAVGFRGHVVPTSDPLPQALHVAGLAKGSVYDGSWKDWGNDDSKPVE